MKFLKKGFEYNNMAKALGSAFVILNGYEEKFYSGLANDYYEFKQDLLILAYLCRRDIVSRMEEYGWVMSSPILVPKISNGKITILFAYQQTIWRMLEFAKILNINEEIQDIMNKGKLYYEIEYAAQKNVKNKI